jgi:MinD-like ATPase involved in chromosome partitioning or flagellar assembly
MVVPGSPVPRTGLSGLLYRTSAGLIKMGPSQQELVRMQLGQQVRTPLAHPPARVAVAGAKGGAGKTTLSLALAATLGRLRHSRIVTYETNHVGTYGTRVVLEHERSMEDLLRLIEKTPNVASIPLPILDLFTSQTPDDRFTILTAPRDPAAARVLGEGEHRKILSLLYRYFDIVIADLDPSILHSSSAYWLGQVADQVIVVSPMAFAGARLADSTLSYVEARRGREWLQQRAIVVVNAIRPGASLAEIEEIDRHFRQRVHHVHRIPWDPHLERGGVFRWDELGESTRDAYLSLAATVGVGFALGQSPNGEGASQG